jgi:hypothetical protein
VDFAAENLGQRGFAILANVQPKCDQPSMECENIDFLERGSCRIVMMDFVQAICTCWDAADNAPVLLSILQLLSLNDTE